MDYNRIKVLCEKKNLPIRDLCNLIQISEAGLYQMFRNKSMKIENLEKIAEALNENVSIFFDDTLSQNTTIKGNKNHSQIVQGYNLGNNNNINIRLHDKEEEIEKLRKENEVLKKDNENLKKDNDNLKNQLFEAKDKIIKLLEK